jgi:hypothetical protein
MHVDHLKNFSVHPLSTSRKINNDKGLHFQTPKPASPSLKYYEKKISVLFGELSSFQVSVLMTEALTIKFKKKTFME